MNIQKAETARELLAEKEALEKAILCTYSEFEISVKVDSRSPKRVWLEAYLKTFMKEEIKIALEERLSKVKKQLKKL